MFMGDKVEESYERFERYRALTYRFFRAYGALNILMLLELLGPASLLSEVARYTKGGAGLRLLEELGLVKRFKADRTEVVMLTDKGSKVARLLIQVCDAILEGDRNE